MSRPASLTVHARIGEYVHDLHARDFVIETTHETHGSGPFPGTHARYVLRSPVRIFSLSEECDVA
jgi:Winged helix domain